MLCFNHMIYHLIFSCQIITTHLAAAYWSPDAVFRIWCVHNGVAKRVNHVHGIVQVDSTLAVGRGLDRNGMTKRET